jgi:hypothetical protein
MHPRPPGHFGISDSINKTKSQYLEVVYFLVVYVKGGSREAAVSAEEGSRVAHIF